MELDRDTLETLVADVKDELQQIKAMLMEVLQWKSEIEEAMSNVQSGGILSIMGKMLGK